MLLRVQLPDKPGSLGGVATAMGAMGADIMAIEIVEKIEGGVIDDFMVSLPPGMLPDSLVSACAELDGVRVLYLSRHQETWGLEGDIETLNRMLADPPHAAELLTQSAPTVFHAQWAALVDATGSRVLTSTELAPEFDAASLQRLAPFDMPHRIELPAEWLDAWPATTAAVAPLDARRAIVLGRQGGPEFLDSELRRLAHLASMAH